jgi:hypothetical protein
MKVPRAARPPRASEVHDSKVRRNAVITPDMIYPNPHEFRPGESPTVRESSDNIVKETRGVRVQTVYVNRAAKKCGIN